MRRVLSSPRCWHFFRSQQDSLIDRLLPTVSTVLPLFSSSLQPTFLTVDWMSPGFAPIANILSSVSSHDLDLPSFSLSLSSLFICSCTFKLVYRSASLYALSLPFLVHVIFFSFTSALSTSYSAETSFHFPSGFACFQVSTELCPPLLPAGCCHLVFVVPHHSLLFHLSLFSVMAFSRTAVVFLTLDSLFLFWDEHEDDRDTLCIVPEFKGAAASGVTDHSSLPFFFIIISIRGRGCKVLSHPPSFHLLVNSPLLVCTA